MSCFTHFARATLLSPNNFIHISSTYRPATSINDFQDLIEFDTQRKLKISDTTIPATYDPGGMIANVQDVMQLSCTDSPNTSCFPFQSLPREIRDQIYASLLRAGDLAILRTTKRLSQEARERLYREGVCRMKVDLSMPPDGDSCFPQGWEHVQNFQFCISFGPRRAQNTGLRFWQLERLADLNETDRKQECLIIIEHSTFDPVALRSTQVSRLRYLFARIARLTTFATVVLKFAPESFETWMGLAPVGRPRLCEQWIARNWSKTKWQLEPSLGPAKIVAGADGGDRRLVFHPQELRSSLGPGAATVSKWTSVHMPFT